MEKQLPVVFEYYTRRIMEGRITSDEEMQQIIKSMCLERDNTAFHVLYTEVYPSEDIHIQTNDIDLCIQNYNTLVKEALRRYYPDTGYLYTPFNSAFAILLTSDINVPFNIVVSENKAVFKDLHDELLNNYGIFISGGIGEQSYQISTTWKSYQQAKDVKSITTKDNYILSTYDFTDSVDLYYYPESLSVQLSGFISTGNKSQVTEIFELINEENMVKRKLSYKQQHWLISDIRGTIFKKRNNILHDNLTPDKIKLLDLIDRQLEGEMSLSSLRNIATELCEVYGSVTKSNDLIVNIQSYINNNYLDPELGLSKISQEFGISENYFSYLFKKEASENFSNYLERLRMIRAKEMVLNHDNNLSEIYQHVGYNNAASFRRAFKKIFGISPKEMRSKLNAK